ncbi:MAG TPA: hypothetical protein VKM35_10900 [Arenimonas sp.]|uniref:DUF7079 family protein n=1 Tax=Arenimonas sp. TaxID=1872635 RepID=UPI002BE77F49|nr:hypothetical protein [Arenimonas sp.]HMB57703.1 hypothetical protein [Arenimonas sp.]
MHETARERVWIALSDLYLDTDIDALIAPCARVLAAAPFSRDELAQLLFEDVHPVLAYNLAASAGVWEGFDHQWLCARIHARAQGWHARMRPSWWFGRREMRRRWSQVDAIIAALRSHAASP